MNLQPCEDYPSGEVPVPILSVVSRGTRHPFKNRLSKLNHAIIKTSFRETVSPYLLRTMLKVYSRSVPLLDSSSVAWQTSTYSGSMPATASSLAAASISFDERPTFRAIRVLACHS